MTALIDPERQFLGCVLQLPPGPARRLLAGMRADDFADPTSAHVFALAIGLVAAEQAPTPVALLDRAMETTDTGPRTGGGNRLHQLGLWLAEVYQVAPILPPEPYGAYVKAVLLKAAWRRAVRAYATRLVQGAEEEWSTPSLQAALDDTGRLHELWDRYHAADTTRGDGTGRLGKAA